MAPHFYSPGSSFSFHSSPHFGGDDERVQTPRGCLLSVHGSLGTSLLPPGAPPRGSSGWDPLRTWFEALVPRKLFAPNTSRLFARALSMSSSAASFVLLLFHPSMFASVFYLISCSIAFAAFFLAVFHKSYRSFSLALFEAWFMISLPAAPEVCLNLCQGYCGGAHLFPLRFRFLSPRGNTDAFTSLSLLCTSRDVMYCFGACTPMFHPSVMFRRCNSLFVLWFPAFLNMKVFYSGYTEISLTSSPSRK